MDEAILKRPFHQFEVQSQFFLISIWLNLFVKNFLEAFDLISNNLSKKTTILFDSA
jgi:hypothetical protein